MNKELVLSNIIGLNPTGTIDFNGTYKLNGANDIVQNTNNISKKNLEKAQTNQIICDNIEHFENSQNIKYNKYVIGLLVLCILIIVIIWYLMI